jgi:hypothetical protein
VVVGDIAEAAADMAAAGMAEAVAVHRAEVAEVLRRAMAGAMGTAVDVALPAAGGVIKRAA